MKNSDLEQILKTAPVPERPGEYWARFPNRVLAEIQRRQATVHAGRRDSQDRSGPSGAVWRAVALRPVQSSGLAAACVVVAFGLCFWLGRNSIDPQFAEAQKCFREIEALFPNQVEAIMLDDHEARLGLAERADVPASTPLYLKICGARGCQRFVTFSGRRIRINGDFFEVLVNRQGAVILMGDQSVWSSSEPPAKAGGFRIEARPLLTTS